MRIALIALAGVLLTGWTPETNWELLEREIGNTVADVTLVAGQPDAYFVVREGIRGYRWNRPHRVPHDDRRCIYTLYARQEGRARSLAAWRVVGIAPPTRGCGPLVPDKPGLFQDERAPVVSKG